MGSNPGVAIFSLFFTKMRQKVSLGLIKFWWVYCQSKVRINWLYLLKKKYIFKIISQNICYYLGTYKIGIYEIEITQKNDWSNYYLDLYDELAIKIDQNRKCGPNKLRNENKSKKWKWFKMVWKYYHDEMWHFKEVQTMTGIHTLRSKICSNNSCNIFVFLKYILPSLKIFSL